MSGSLYLGLCTQTAPSAPGREDMTNGEGQGRIGGGEGREEGFASRRQILGPRSSIAVLKLADKGDQHLIAYINAITKNATDQIRA